MGRICHNIQDVFPEKFKNKYYSASVNINSKTEGYFFCLLGYMEYVSWKDAKNLIEGGGGGYFLISSTGKQFCAVSEGEPPEYLYTGCINN